MSLRKAVISTLLVVNLSATGLYAHPGHTSGFHTHPGGGSSDDSADLGVLFGVVVVVGLAFVLLRASRVDMPQPTVSTRGLTFDGVTVSTRGLTFESNQRSTVDRNRTRSLNWRNQGSFDRYERDRGRILMDF